MDNNGIDESQPQIDSSLKSILKVTIPVILSTLSINLMYLTDRLLLAAYSFDAMNAAAIAGNLVAAFTYLIGGIAGTAEVYVGQYNGSKQYDKLAAPIWQMIYLSLLSIVVLWPLAYFSEYFNTLPPYYLSDGVAYQSVLMYFGFIPGLIVALSAFFIGQGKARIVSMVVISGTALNALLSYFFIFEMRQGCRGAAIGTVISEIFQVVLLTAVIFAKKNRKTFNTVKNNRFNKELFCSCIRIGAPIAIGNFTALLAWCSIHTIMGYASKDLATIYGLCINLYILFLFAGEGASKAIASIASNMIGRSDFESIRRTVKVFIWLTTGFCFCTVTPMLIAPDWIVQASCNLHEGGRFLAGQCKTALYVTLANVPIEAVLYIYWGVLLSGGDTKYAMFVHQVVFWTTVVLPVYIMYKFGVLSSAAHVFFLMMLWMTIVDILFYKRYRLMKWYNKLV
ncbi:MAG: MATE family efflux transporter [Holosporales bacterium]|jgi:MATE family multidrug resistance protein|nr:MATE family efflux transporter [Holosporales bacterium]